MIFEQLKKSRNVLLSAHIKPDGDSLGSMISMGSALTRLGKKVTLFNESAVPAVYRFLPSIDSICHKLDDFSEFDTAIIMDCGELQRIGSRYRDVQNIPVIINIDHHVTNTGFGHFQMVDPDACSTTEIVYRILKKMDVKIDKTSAVAIYTGILTDTGSFRFSNTNKNAFSICHEMVESGADPFTVAQNVYGTYSLGRIKLLNKVLDSIEVSENGKLSLMTLTREMIEGTGTKTEDVAGLVNYVNHIEDVKVAALIQEADRNGPAEKREQFHVSLRSDGTVDVAQIAATFGGGGHKSAAGFTVTVPFSSLKNHIMEIAEAL